MVRSYSLIAKECFVPNVLLKKVENLLDKIFLCVISKRKAAGGLLNRKPIPYSLTFLFSDISILAAPVKYKRCVDLARNKQPSKLSHLMPISKDGEKL
jgi:hypothetical protein